MRVSSVVTLTRDARHLGPDGHPYLRYFNVEGKREAMLPIAPAPLGPARTPRGIPGRALSRSHEDRWTAAARRSRWTAANTASRSGRRSLLRAERCAPARGVRRASSIASASSARLCARTSTSERGERPGVDEPGGVPIADVGGKQLLELVVRLKCQQPFRLWLAQAPVIAGVQPHQLTLMLDRLLAAPQTLPHCGEDRVGTHVRVSQSVLHKHRAAPRRAAPSATPRSSRRSPASSRVDSARASST